MNTRHTTLMLATAMSVAVCFGAGNDPPSPALPILPPELASYEPRGGRNLAEQVRVNTTTGDLSYWETDLTIAGTASAPVLQRFYRAQAPGKEAGLFGRGWRTILERRLVALNENTYVLADEWGATWLFSKRDDGRWWGDRGPARRIERAADALVLFDADGLTWRFDSSGRLMAVADNTGQQLTIERDPDHPSSLRRVHDSWGNSFSFTMNGDGLVERVASSDGRSISYEYRQGLLIGAQTGSGAGSGYAYDTSERLREINLSNGSSVGIKTDERGRVTNLSGKGIVTRTYSYRERDQAGQSVAETARIGGLGDVARWRVFEGGRRIEMAAEPTVLAVLENNDRGIPAQLTLGEKSSWRWRYDAQGRLVVLEGPQNETTRFVYSGNRLQPDRIERPDGSAVRFEYDRKERRVAVAVGNQRPWRCEYDESGRLQKFDDFFRGRCEIAYDAKGRIASLVEPGGTKVLVDRDAQGRMVSVGRSGGATIRFDRDAAGRVESIGDGLEWLRFECNDSANVTCVLSSQGYARRFYYTVEGMPSTLQGAGQRALRLFYDGERNCIAFQRSDHTALHIARGPFNQVRTLDAAGSGRWTVDYDAWARPIRWQKQGYEPARLNYDGVGRVRAIESPSDGRLALGYGPNGKLISLETPLRRFQFVFDPVGQVQTLVELTGSKRDTFEYDDANRLVRRSSPAGTEQYRYDRAGRVATWIVTDLASRAFGFRYGDAGWLEEIAYPNGVRVTFDYDAAQRLTRVGARDGEGRALLTMPIDHATSSRLAAATGGGSDRFVYRYDPNLALVETGDPNGRRDFFAYDPRGNFLLTTSTTRREVVRRDALGRPIEVGSTRYVYAGPNDTPSSITTSTVCLTLDDRERVIALRRGDGLKAKYAYLPDGRMIRREVKGRAVWFDWDGPRLRSPYDERGRVLASIHYDPTFGLPLAVTMARQVYFCHPNAFGHVALLTDEKGKTVDPPPDFPFDVNGRSEAPIGPTWEGLPPAIRLPEEGLYLVRGRLCDLRSGDFLSPDGARFVASENPYRAREIARPLELTAAWDELAQIIQWLERIESPRFQQRRESMEQESPLSALVPVIRQPEIFESRLIETAFRHDLNPDWWFDSVLPMGLTLGTGMLPCGPQKLPPSPADMFSDFSPLGVIPYDWGAGDFVVRAR